MNKMITTVAALALVGFSATTFAQDARSDAAGNAARQQRMDEAYVAHRDGPAEHSSVHPVAAVKRDTRAAGHAIHNGVRETGHAIHQGVRATGHAVHQGVRATGHAIHHGVDKITGR
jgi:dihydroorotase-like cyclic amidohydrolase